jgi:hypothetical protein
VQRAPHERHDQRSAGNREDDEERDVGEGGRNGLENKVCGDARQRQRRRCEVAALGRQAAPLRSDGGSMRSTSIVHSFTAAAIAAIAASMGSSTAPAHQA